MKTKEEVEEEEKKKKKKKKKKRRNAFSHNYICRINYLLYITIMSNHFQKIQERKLKFLVV